MVELFIIVLERFITSKINILELDGDFMEIIVLNDTGISLPLILHHFQFHLSSFIFINPKVP